MFAFIQHFTVWFLQTTEDHFHPHNNADTGKCYPLFYTYEAEMVESVIQHHMTRKWQNWDP